MTNRWFAKCKWLLRWCHTLRLDRKRKNKNKQCLCEAFKGFKEPYIPSKKIQIHAVNFRRVKYYICTVGEIAWGILCKLMPAAYSSKDSLAHCGSLQLSEQTALISPHPSHACLCNSQELQLLSSSFEPLMVTSAVDNQAFTRWSAPLNPLTRENFCAICDLTFIHLEAETSRVLLTEVTTKPQSGFCACPGVQWHIAQGSCFSATPC